MRRAELLAVALGFGVFGCCKPFKWDCAPGPIASVTECLSAGPGPSTTSCTGADTEPNDTLPMARAMPAGGCGFTPVKGSLGSDQDTDYFHSRSTLCDGATAVLKSDTEDVTACLFVQCSTASTSIATCSDGSIVMHHPSGLLGCCSTTTDPVSFPVYCDGKNQSVDVFLVTSKGPSNACTPYSVEYHL